MRLSKASALGGALGRGGTEVIKTHCIKLRQCYHGYKPSCVIFDIKTHRIKLRQCYCDAVLSGEKRAELRINDRDYQKGDYIVFLPVSDEGAPVEHEVSRRAYRITHVLSGVDGLYCDYVVLSIREEVLNG